ncbi:MAG: beta galactosidase jelly roll domain-containing protein [Anaerolineae bacterium]|nr:beta galactosidase jelly roll domain-containing protein [Anaerolineae bacterium]
MSTLPPDIPRPEHPRPDFERADWLNLNGVWQFCYDPDGALRGAELSRGVATAFDQTIVVPFPWQSALSGQHNVDYHGVAWYRRTFAVPRSWAGKRVFIRFGAVDYQADAWINGVHLGQHEGGYSAFEFEITPQLLEGENTLVVRADDPANLYEIPHGKQASLPPDPWQQVSFTASSGIWQTVWLEARPQSYIEAARFTPDVEGKQVRIDLTLIGPDEDVSLSLHITSPSGEPILSEHKARLGSKAPHTLRLAIPLTDMALWDIHAPNLYAVALTLTAPDGSRDVVHSYFGMRHIEQRDGQIWLNGRPIYLMTALDQGYWPDGIYTAPSDDALRADVAYAKAIGLNGLRKHLKVEDPRFMYWADRLGLLLWCDMPCPTVFTALACERLQQELTAMVERDYNHPSIVVWCPYNETWGLEFSLQTDAAMQTWVARLYDDLKAADPTRLVVDNSGWSHVRTDLADFHYYTGNVRDWRTTVQRYADAPEHTGVYAFKLMADDHAYDGAPLVLSEFGYGWQHDSSWGLRWATNELRRHPAIVGYTYCELYDVEYEYCGYALYDRTPKQFGYDLKAINSADFIVLDYQGALVHQPGDDVRIAVLFSAYDHPPLECGRLRWQLKRVTPPGLPEVVLCDGGWEFAVTPFTVAPVGEIHYVAPSVRGPVQLFACVEDENGVVRARNTLDFEVYHPGQSFFEQAETQDAFHLTLSITPGGKAKSFWNDGDHRLGYFVDDRPGAVWFEGAGKVAFRLPVISRAGFPDHLSDVALFFELGARPAEITQSVEGRSQPSDVTISLNGQEIETVRLDGLPVNAAGALTRIHNTGVGEHGQYVQVRVPAALLGQVIQDARAKGHFLVELEVKSTAHHPGGLTVFGARTGRYGIDPSVRIAVPKPAGSQ